MQGHPFLLNALDNFASPRQASTTPRTHQIDYAHSKMFVVSVGLRAEIPINGLG